MTLLRPSLASPRTTRFHRLHRAFVGGAAGRTRKPAFVPRLLALEDRTLLTTLVVDPAGGTGIFTTIQAAVNAASAAGGDTIQIHPATYTEQVTIDKSLTMMGTGSGVVIQAPSTLTPDPTFNLRSLVEVMNAATVDISNLTVSGPAPNINDGILIVQGATANVTDVTVTEIQDPSTFGDQTGFAIQIGGTGAQAVGQVGNATVTDCTITAYQKVGVIVGRSGSTGTITGCTITGAGPTSLIAQNGIQIGPGSASASVSNSTISGNQFTGTGSGPNGVQSTGLLDYISTGSITGNTIDENDEGLFSSPAGATAVDLTTSSADLTNADLGIPATGPGLTITGNTLSGNLFENLILRQGTSNVTGNIMTGANIGVLLVAVGTTNDTVGNIESNNITNNGNGGSSSPAGGIVAQIGSGATTTVQATANFNRIVGNSVGVDNTTTAAVDATLNWWGSNTGPNTTGSDTTTGGTVNTSPWLVLSLSASPATIGAGATAVVTADLTKDSDGATHSTAPFFPDQVPIAFTATGGTITPASVPTSSGTAASSFTSSTPGTASASAALDNQTLSTPITIQSTPTVTGLSPTTGSPAGGTSVTITGTGFTGATAVNFGTTAAESFTVVNDTTIIAVSPPETGALTVTVVTPNGTSPSSAAAQFTFVAASPTVVSLMRFGFHMQQTTLVLTFSSALAQAPAQNVNNYQLVNSAGASIPITSAVYDPTTLTVTLTPSQLLNLQMVYQLTVIGMPPGGLTSATGVPLDGAGNGTAGTNYVKMFSGEILAGPATALQTTAPKIFAAKKKELATKEKLFHAETKKPGVELRKLAAARKQMAAREKRLAAETAKSRGSARAGRVRSSSAVATSTAASSPPVVVSGSTDRQTKRDPSPDRTSPSARLT